MKYSKSFPSSRAWFSAIRLFFPTYVCAIAVFAFFFWSWLFMAIIVGIAGSLEAFAILAGIALAALIGGFIWYVAIKIIYRLLLALLWSNPPKWLSPSKWSSTFYHYSVSLLAAMPTSVVFLLHVWSKVSFRQLGVDVTYYKIYAPELIVKMAWVWFIYAAYLYHCENSVRQSRKQEKLAKQTPSS